MTRVLVTGSFGQIGTELVPVLRARYGEEAVLATGVRLPSVPRSDDRARRTVLEGAAVLDVTDLEAVESLIRGRRIDLVYHLAARLSAVGELDPMAAWQVNMNGLVNVLEAARRTGGVRVFWPSSIAVFGPDAPRDQVPQDAPLNPTTLYGVTKVAGELVADYYVRKYELDVRGVRYPGVISSQAPPGGGTTDYAVEMFRAAAGSGEYTAFVREDCALPMIYMPDCLEAAISLMEVDRSRLSQPVRYNLMAMTFTAGELAAEIRKHRPGFRCRYEPDARQLIADSWPRSIDDSPARADWNWQPGYDLERMTRQMLDALTEGQ